MSKTISAIFNDPRDARHVVEELLVNQVGREEISVLMNEETEQTWNATPVTGPPIEGVAIDTSETPDPNATEHDFFEPVALPIVALGTMGAPGLGLMGAGPVVTAMAAANAGWLGDGIGFFGGLGNDYPDSASLTKRIRDGAVLIAVHSHANGTQIREILERNHGEIARAA